MNAWVRSAIFTLRLVPGVCPWAKSANPTTMSGRSFRTASTYSPASSCLNPTDVNMEIELGVLFGGQAIEGTRRGPRMSRKSSGTLMNLRNADSCGAVGTLYMGGLPFRSGPVCACLSMTDLSPGGHRTSSASIFLA